MFIFVGEADTCIDHRYMFMHKYYRVVDMRVTLSISMKNCMSTHLITKRMRFFFVFDTS